MKKTYIISGLVSLVMSLGVIGIYHFTKPEDINIKHVNTVPGQKVLYAANADGEITPLDFTKTTDKVLDAVVHVKSKGTANTAIFQYRELPDPFKDFFQDSPFGNFFERRYQQSPKPDNKSEDNGQSPLPTIGSGSGVIINENGYIITNNHVIENADEVEITLHDNSIYKANVIGTDPSTDLALLQIKADNLTAIPFVNSDDVNVGEWVLAIGNPFSLNSTVTAGIVSAKARNINVNKDRFAVESFIQTDAAINPGNSGGALVNLNGDLIGINTAIASRTGTYNGYGFAIPSNIVSKVVEDILKYGAVQRGMLGINIMTLDSNIAKEQGIDLTQGVYVAGVNEDSGADEAGIQEKDVIIKVNDKTVNTSPELQEIIARKRPGDKVDVTLVRNGKEKTIAVTLKGKNGSTKVKKREHVEILNLLGADFETLDKETAKTLNIDGGVRLTELYAGRLKKDTQIKKGFIITHVDGTKVDNLKAFMQILENKKGGVMLEGVYEDIPGTHYYAFGING
jgi:Do/DeqQ family serine protease